MDKKYKVKFTTNNPDEFIKLLNHLQIPMEGLIIKDGTTLSDSIVKEIKSPQWREEFYKKFSYIQAIKNEASGNCYQKVSDFIETQIAQARRIGYTEGYEQGKKDK